MDELRIETRFRKMCYLRIFGHEMLASKDEISRGNKKDKVIFLNCFSIIYMMHIMCLIVILKTATRQKYVRFYLFKSNFKILK